MMSSGATSHVDTYVRDRLPPATAQPDFLFDLPALHYPPRLNAAVELIDRGLRDAIAVMNASGRWTYKEMADLADRIARVLVEEEGLVPGGRVFLRGPNGAMLFACWLGILKAGGIVVATMPILRAGEIDTIMTKARIGHALVDARCLDDYSAASAAGSARLMTYDGDSGTGELERRAAATAPGFVAVDTSADDPALIAFTSGTTGVPKGCVHYHRDILASADSFAAEILRPAPGGIWTCTAPLAFTFGLGMILIFPWRFGGTAVTIERPGPEALLEAIGRYRITHVATAPTAYKAMLGLRGAHDLTSLTTCVSAGEHLPEATWQAWRDATGLSIIDGIGATEMMHIFISASGDAIRPGATGKAVPGYVATVLDESGRPMAEGTGRLAVKGPTGCRYFDDPRQADYVQGGWNVTGDTYRVDADGYFWYVARSDDMIVTAGYNIGAPEVENALLSHPAVSECAVIGAPCPERGQKVKAYIVAAPDAEPGEPLAEALKAHVKAVIAPYKYPRDIAFVDALPKTATGKLRRVALREAEKT